MRFEDVGNRIRRRGLRVAQSGSKEYADQKNNRARGPAGDHQPIRAHLGFLRFTQVFRPPVTGSRCGHVHAIRNLASVLETLLKSRNTQSIRRFIFLESRYFDLLNKINVECTTSTSRCDQYCHLLDLFVSLLTPLEILIFTPLRESGPRSRPANHRKHREFIDPSALPNPYQQLRHLVLGHDPPTSCPSANYGCFERMVGTNEFFADTDFFSGPHLRDPSPTETSASP